MSVEVDVWRYDRANARAEAADEARKESMRVERWEYETALRGLPSFFVETVAGVDFASADGLRLMAALRNRDSAECGAVVVKIINRAASRQVDDTIEGIDHDGDYRQMMEFWK